MRWLFVFFIVVSAIVVMTNRTGPWPNESLDAATILAKRDHRPVIAIVGAEWCGYCKKLDRRTLSNAEVKDALKGFHVVKIDADSSQGKEFSAKYGVQGLPTVVFMDEHGTEKDRIEGYVPPEVFLTGLRK